MSVDNIPKEVKVGIRLANDVNVDDIYDYDGSGDISGADYLGPIRDHTGACATYAEVLLPTAVNRGSDDNMNEEVSVTSDLYDRPIFIKRDGSGSFEAIENIKNSASVVDSFNLAYACEYFPMGITGTVTSGSPGTADEAGRYDPFDDDPDNTGFGDGYAGYNIVVEQPITVGVDPKYKQTVYSNCYIKRSHSYKTQGASRITVEWSKPRDKEEIKAAAASLIA